MKIAAEALRLAPYAVALAILFVADWALDRLGL